MDLKHLRAWWARKQGLDQSLLGRRADEILQRTGWGRSVGGSSPYVTLFARGGLERSEIDDALASLEIHELPSARGCTHVLPASDFGFGLRCAQTASSGEERRTAEKLGVPTKELDRLAERVLLALKEGALSPDELRDRLGAAVRNLGAEGKKKGLTTTLPVVLG